MAYKSQENTGLGKKYPLYLITWKDAESECKWDSIEQTEEWAKKDALIYEIGWIVSQNDKYVVVSNQVTDDNMLGNKTKIPRGWILKKQRINLEKVLKCRKRRGSK